MTVLHKALVLGVILVNGTCIQGMLVPLSGRGFRMVKRQQNIRQRRSNFTAIPTDTSRVDQQQEIHSIKDLTRYIENDIQEATRKLFSSDQEFQHFMKEREEDNECINKHYRLPEKEIGKMHDTKASRDFVEKLNKRLRHVSINPHAIGIISSSRLKENCSISCEVRDRLYRLLVTLYPSMHEDILKRWIQYFEEGNACLRVGGVVLKKDNNRRAFFPPIIMISDILEGNKKSDTSDSINYIVNYHVNNNVGAILLHHMNMNYHLLSAVCNTEETKKQFFLLRNLQDRIADVACDMHNPEIARENNAFYRNAIRLAPIQEEKTLMTRLLIMSMFIMQCHRYDARIVE